MASKKIINLKELLKRRENLILRLPDFKEFIIGNIQKNLFFKCGTLKCKCKDKKNPELHGPYTHLSIRSSEKTKNFYLKKDRIKDMEKYLKNYDKIWATISKLSLINYQIYKLQKDKNEK
jgi:hypothetical protein